ncbi:MAG: long-chain fatty acid--CoA ligase [Chloroflexota bacterium]|nr:MAG: long-chain fatty acid--CoA ligase [Chloroflexota bacterium]
MTGKPWLAHYDPAVPKTLAPYPRRTLIDLVGDAARRRPEHPALLFHGASLTYSELDRLSDALAVALLQMGIRSGDRVTLLMPNCPNLIIAQLGAWKAGAIVSPLNPLYAEQELEHALEETGSVLAITLTPYYAGLKAIQPRTSIKRIIATSIKEFLTFTDRMLFTLFKERKEGHQVKLEQGDLWLHDLLERHAGARPTTVPVEPEAPALLMFTGGTTGRSKAALSSHQALLMSGLQIRAWLAGIREDWKDVTLLLMPMFHTYGNVGAFSAAVVSHNTMVPIADPRDLKDLIQTIEQTRPSYLCGVPTLFSALFNHPQVMAGQVDFSSIKLCLCGAAALMLETKRRFETLTGGRIVEGYALTETVMGAVATPVQGVYKEGAVGLPLPDVEIRIVDQCDGLTVLPPGEIGEILFRAPQMMLGYWKRPEATSETIRAGWLYTGDLGYMDEDGYLYLVDRVKDVIKPSGFQVWPREVEEVLTAHPAVNEAGVAGIPDPDAGEAVKAWVVRTDKQEVSESELRTYCRKQLTAYKVPKHVEFVDSLPKSAVGKVLRRKLASAESVGRPVLT